MSNLGGGAAPSDADSLPGFLQLCSEQRLWWVRTCPGKVEPATSRIARFLAFSRPRTCVPGMLAFYLACVMNGHVATRDVVVGMVISYHLAALANLYNMYTDIAEDNENIPSRVFELGQYGRTRLLRDTHLLAAAVVMLSLTVNRYFAAVSLLAVIGCQQYSFRPLRMKARPRVGIFYFANAVAYPYVSAALASADRWHAFANRDYAVMAVYLLVWFSAKGLIKNVPDYDGDKQVRVTTSATLCASRHAAALVAAVATVVVYGAVCIPVLAGLLEPKFFLASWWLPIACIQAWRLIGATDLKSSNDMLRDDMFVSVGYLSTLILIAHPSIASGAVLFTGLAIMVLSDLLKLDTRKKEDFG